MNFNGKSLKWAAKTYNNNNMIIIVKAVITIMDDNCNDDDCDYNSDNKEVVVVLVVIVVAMMILIKVIMTIMITALSNDNDQNKLNKGRKLFCQKNQQDLHYFSLGRLIVNDKCDFKLKFYNLRQVFIENSTITNKERYINKSDP